MVSIQDLQHDLLVLIAEKVNPEDLANLRLASKPFHAAVHDAEVALRPCNGLTQAHVRKLCRIFPKATGLTLSHAVKLDLSVLLPLRHTLRHLDIRGLEWPWDPKLPLVQSLTHLETLSVESQFGDMMESLLMGSEEKVSPLSSLQTLAFRDCQNLKTLPRGLGSLAALKELNLGGCSQLPKLPRAICELQLLRKLSLRGCRALTVIPEDIGALSTLQVKACGKPNTDQAFTPSSPPNILIRVA